MTHEITKVPVNLGDRSYNIHIGKNILKNADDYLPFDITQRNLFIVYDKNVYPFAQVLEEALASAPSVKMMPIQGGEKTKSYDGYQDVMSWLLENNVNRQSVLIALGGGVIGDLGGFVASTVMRGIDYVQIPTTLLSQIDSSVGGKTGINTAQGKNLVGSFYQPVSVLCDTGTLSTLPERELRAGYGEMVKYGLINDKDFFDWLEVNGRDVLSLNYDAVQYAVEKSCHSKALIVAQDEKEAGQRALLNLGHTFGHALEAACAYDGRLLHGEAVAIGMVMAFALSVKMGICNQEDYNTVIQHFDDHGLQTKASQISPPIKQSADALVLLMAKDKKVKAGAIGFILTHGIGKAYQTYDVNLDDVTEVVRQSLEG